MRKLSILYIVSQVILGVLVAFTIFSPMSEGGEYSEVLREQLLRTEDEWIIQFNIINREGSDQNYTITAEIDGKQSSKKVTIQDGRVFTYIYHIYPDRITEGSVTFTIGKEGMETPFEQITYHLK